MEAKRVSQKRERPWSSLSCNGNEANGTPIDHKRPRPSRTSGLLMRNLVKDLRSHRVFSPSSELYREMADQKFGFEFGPFQSDDASKSARDGGLGKCLEPMPVPNSDSKIKPFIRRCFQRKVFKNLGSVSYRRLLPYLMDIAKQEPCEVEIDRSFEIAKDLEGKKSEALISSQSDEVLNGGVDKDTVSPECLDNHLEIPDKLAPESAIDSSNLEPTSSDTIDLSPSSTVVEDGEITIVDSSPVSGDSHLGKDVELCQHSEVTNSVTMHTIEDQTQNEEKSEDDGEVMMNQVDDLVEESNQMTPPDSEIFRSFAVEGNESDIPDCDQNSGIHSDKVHREISSLANTTRHEFNSKISGVLKPRSQMKLFRSPGSFSYKRMLPFIMDIAKENSDASANGQIKKQPSLNKPVLPVPASTPISDSSYEIENSRSDTESRMPLSSHEEDILQVKEVVSTEERATSLAALGSDCVQTGDRDKLQHTQSLQSYLVSSRNESDCPKKGILKRNPRGCRGLCTCLNCASFRLHADRAFEFTRNQMEDTEELVLDLVGELSYLRDVLEKSAGCADNQVKEACKKSSEVEELAKNRLRDMNYDLDIHCRITCVERQSVKFADRVKEYTIEKPNANSSGISALKL